MPFEEDFPIANSDYFKIYNLFLKNRLYSLFAVIESSPPKALDNFIFASGAWLGAYHKYSKTCVFIHRCKHCIDCCPVDFVPIFHTKYKDSNTRPIDYQSNGVPSGIWAVSLWL